MSFIVTARKWRPQRFDEVVGQQHISKTIKNAIANNRIAHAYIFAGPRGIGKTTTARIFAKALNCLNLQDGEPCNVCDNCKHFNTGQSLDIIEIDGASNRRIEEIRTLRESVKYAPMSSKYKVYIIDEVHMLTTESFNALLKTLEEPPEHVVFIFATTDVHKVPLTIISRCQRFDFRRIEAAEIKALLKKIADAENIQIDDHSLTIISRKADGALRDAQSLFDQVASFCDRNITIDAINKMFNFIDEDIYFKISDAILQKDFSAAFEITEQIYQNGWNFIDFANEMMEHFRNILTVIIRKDAKLITTNENTTSKYLNYINQYSESDLLRIISYLSKYAYEIKTATNPKLHTEITLSTLIGLESSKSISEILKILSGDKNFEGVKKKVVSKASFTSNDNTPEIPEVKYSAEEKRINDSKSSDINDKQEKSANELSLNSIKKNWKNFLAIIESEKITLASHLTLANPIDLSGKNLTVEITKPEDLEIINNMSYLKYLSEKSTSVFSEKLKFNFISQNIQNQKGKANSSAKNDDNIEIELTEDEQKIVEAIKKELGGIEFGS